MDQEDFMDVNEYPCQICLDADSIGLPQIPDIPQIALCLHFPGTDGWNSHWADFNQKVKEFHQSMIDFNCRIIEWYYLKSKQLERFGKKTLYVAGTLVTAPHVTLVYTRTVFDVDVLSEIRKCLPCTVEQKIRHLERTGYKLFLAGMIFIFNHDQVIAIDYECKDWKKTCFKAFLKFSLFYKNEKVNVAEAFQRVYGGLKFSFLVGGIGGLITSYLTGYFNEPSFFKRRCAPGRNVFWWVFARFLTSAACYTIIERILLLKFTRPQKYILSGSTGLMCGVLLGFCDNRIADTIIHGAMEYGIFSLLCNLFAGKHLRKENKVGCSNKDEITST